MKPALLAAESETGIMVGGESGAGNIGGAHVLYFNLHKFFHQNTRILTVLGDFIKRWCDRDDADASPPPRMPGL